MSGLWWRRAAWALAYACAVLLGRQLVLEQSGLALFWPAAGVATLWMLSVPRRGWVWDGVLLLVVTTSVNVVLGTQLFPGVLFGVANVVQALGAAAVLRRVAQDPAASLPAVLVQRDLVTLTTAVAGASLASSVPGTVAGWLASGHWSWLTWLAWLARNFVGAFLVVLVAIVVLDRLRRGLSISANPEGHPGHLTPKDVSTGRPRELVAAVGVSALVTAAVFGSGSSLPLAFLAIATSAWVAVRFSPWVVVLHTALQSVAVLSLTFAGLGPFASVAGLDHRVLVAQTFVAVNMLLTMMLAVGATERERLLATVTSAEARARTQAELLTAVSDVMREGLLVLDPGGRIVLANPAAYELTGLDPHQEVNLDSVAEHGFGAPDGSDLPRSELPHTRALAGERVEAMDVLRRATPDLPERLISVTGTSLHYIDNQPMAVMGLRDVTVERLERRELDAFAGVVAHDLKNPIAAVLSWCEILDEQLDPLAGASDARASLTRIYGATDRMQRLVGDLLGYARAGSEALHLAPARLEELVAEVARDLGLETRLASTGSEAVHVATAHIDADVEVVVDEVLVRQLLLNLMGNAVKYVAEGTIPEVRVSARDTGGMIEVTIHDNGIGIPAADRPRVFDSFYRASNTGGFSGTGLGLAICARAVERHGGSIGIDPTQREGTSVVLTLPGTARQKALVD